MNAINIHGNVNADGSIYSGSKGYNVTKKGKGLYLIQFENGFEHIPSASVTQNYPQWNDFNNQGGMTTDNAIIVALNNKQLLVKTGDGGGIPSDRNFSFLVLGGLLPDFNPIN